MILIPKYKEYELDLGITHRIGLGGQYRLVRYNSMGQMNYDTGWVKNLITDLGLAHKAVNDGASFGGWNAYFYIGSSSAMPANSDVSMGALLPSGFSQTSQGTMTRNDIPVAPNYEKWNQQTKRFAAGVGTGTIREVGWGGNTTSVGQTCCRQLVSPAVTKASDEVVDVTWRITQYPDITDRASTIVIDSITYDTVMRGLNMDVHNDFSGCFAQIGSYIYAGFSVSDSGLVAKTNTSLAANTLNGQSGDWYGEYAWGANYVDMYHKYQLNSGNLANGIRTMRLQHSGPDTELQIQFTAQTPTTALNPLCIPKDNTKELSTNWRATWVRH